MFSRLDILIIHVADIEKSAHFYKNILNLKQLKDESGWKTFEMDHQILALQTWDAEIKDERPVKYGITLAFDIDDVDTTILQLKAKGAHILVEPRTKDFGRFAEIVDPDGYIIMLVTTTPKI